MAIPTKIVSYDGTNVGRIYLRDVGQRNGLGGGGSIYELGQDQYINYGQDATLVQTGDVLLSIDRGVIKTFTEAGVLSVA